MFSRWKTLSPGPLPLCSFPDTLSRPRTAGVIVAQGQDPALGLVEPLTIGLSPWIQPLQPALQQIHMPTLASSFAPLDCFPRGSVNRLLNGLNSALENSKVTVLLTPLLSSPRMKIVIVMPMTISNQHITHSSFTVQKKEVSVIPDLNRMDLLCKLLISLGKHFS
ncbi:hypothetical protein HGM15179_012723 [Zosterops borbonicus]|uniref:Uncharacterized protein n=1 Tax=Zosterops borbonicus TaxID=364589 RepID=A0A8K1G9P4_9PASS|nr:hypothetical protein HGM15179_012723 [Zosterops borbonicus]